MGRTLVTIDKLGATSVTKSLLKEPFISGSDMDSGPRFSPITVLNVVKHAQLTTF